MAEPSPSKVAFVTGAASGIGRAVALRLARDGYDVALFDRDGDGASATAEIASTLSVRALSQATDVTSADELEHGFGHAAESLGPPSALVSSAGVLSLSPALDLDAAEWRRVVEINLTGTFLADQAAARLMQGAGVAGSIVNVASVHSLSPSRGLAHYDASKGGLWMLTKNLALELAADRIRVNAVAPGLITNTRLAAPDRQYLDSTVREIPLGRAGEPDDVTGPVSFLCSADASYVTGAMLVVDGGMLLTARL